jgi:hypothetical protein
MPVFDLTEDLESLHDFQTIERTPSPQRNRNYWDDLELLLPNDLVGSRIVSTKSSAMDCQSSQRHFDGAVVSAARYGSLCRPWDGPRKGMSAKSVGRTATCRKSIAGAPAKVAEGGECLADSAISTRRFGPELIVSDKIPGDVPAHGSPSAQSMGLVVGHGPQATPAGRGSLQRTAGNLTLFTTFPGQTIRSEWGLEMDHQGPRVSIHSPNGWMAVAAMLDWLQLGRNLSEI